MVRWDLTRSNGVGEGRQRTKEIQGGCDFPSSETARLPDFGDRAIDDRRSGGAQGVCRALSALKPVVDAQCCDLRLSHPRAFHEIIESRLHGD
jgi:hypothetical protein